MKGEKDMMSEKQIRDMLTRYKPTAGRIKHLEIEKGELEKKLEKAKKEAVDAMAGPHPANIDGMPRGNRKSDPTAVLGAKLADGVPVSAEVAALEGRLKDLEEALQVARNDMAYMNAWISCLLDRDLLLVNRKLIEGQTWAEVARGYQDRFGDEMSERTLGRMLENAIHQIWLMTEV